MPADDGPADWQRITVAVDETRAVPDPNRGAENPDTRGKQVDIVVPQEQIDPVALPPVTVSDVVMNEQDISFHVDKVGVPVLVKVSYFPNWTAHGAEGPYRIAPNMMVVVPTSNDVRLTFDRSTSDLFFYALTGLGILLLIASRIWGDRLLARHRPPVAAPARPRSPARPAARSDRHWHVRPGQSRNRDPRRGPRPTSRRHEAGCATTTVHRPRRRFVMWMTIRRPMPGRRDGPAGSPLT